MRIYMKVAYMSIHRNKLMAGGALLLLLAAGVFGLFQKLDMSIMFLAMAMAAVMLAILGYNHTTNQRIFAGEKVIKADVARLADKVNAVSRLQETAFLESGKRQLVLLEESKNARDSHEKSLGLLFREVRYISSILSGAEPVLSQQDEKRLTTCLLALNVAKRDLETAINRLAMPVKVDD